MIETDAIPAANKLWVKPQFSEPGLIFQLSSDLGISEILAGLLVSRGIRDSASALQFLNPGREQLHDPFLMDGMEQAVQRIHRALQAEEKVLVFGDYDVDGTTSVALIMKGLQAEFGEQISFYVPDRYKEGYGISEAGINHAASLGCKLIIALDCGIRSVDKVEYAKSLGIDFIICDHHLPGEQIPEAVAVLDPKKPGCHYPYKELSGAAIGYKLLQALHLRGIISVNPENFADLVALSVAADIVEMKGENRVLAFLGLERINNRMSPVISKMLDGATKEGSPASEKPAGISDLVFKTAPLINAAGRIGHASQAVNFLLSQDENEINIGYAALVQLNHKRVNLDKQITDEALLIIRNSERLLNSQSTVLYNPEWHKGVVGIVASRVMEKYYRPTIILTGTEGKITGSARSVKGFDIHQAISACSDLLLQYGGHQAAAGLTLHEEYLERFIARFEEVVSETLKIESKTEEIQTDFELQPFEINDKLYREINKLAPFGPGNMTPVFVATGLTDSGWARIVGNSHLKMKLGRPGSGFTDAIAFGQAHFFNDVSNNVPVDVCYTIDENHWNGRVNLQMMIKDMRK
ncbi:MAG: single-stranded-DNA-specific exonuclease RecJ [Bacteroidetes bacterium]|nr:single-stranded-DNA-specific exonuclease RecJ [Bacteroidota bacterium]